jgi:predicted component of type VI protein secretion system
MSWKVYVRAIHGGGKRVEWTIDRLPLVLGRDEAQSACLLDDDPSVSKVHASVDVRDGRLLVRDVRSTNGTFSGGRLLETHRWNDVGEASDENEITIGGWQVFVRARRAAAARPAASRIAGTVLDPTPFGASQARTSVGDASFPTLLRAFPAVADRLSELVHASRSALAALERAVAHEVNAATEEERPALLTALREHYPEVRTSAFLAEVASSARNAADPSVPEAQAVALASLQDLSRWYVDGAATLNTESDVSTFKDRLRAGTDALVLGLVQALSGLDVYVRQMQLDSEPAHFRSARSASEFARSLFDWRNPSVDGAELVRRAFMELSVHQVALLNAVFFGLRDLLDELAPDAIERARATALAKQGFWARLTSRITAPREWLETYRQRYLDLTSEEGARFALLFGPSFAEEYRSFVQESRASARATSARSEPVRGGTVPFEAGMRPNPP